MDPVTHGITGALLGKGYFHERSGRVATFAVVLGAVFPDIDIVADFVTRDPLAIVKYHRAITHSFVALPFFAVLLAWLTRWVCRRYRIEAPSWGLLTVAYGVGIASHIILDGMTSFGTRMWFPISNVRVAWDLLFIVDFGFTSVLLLPQMIAWIYSDAVKSRSRAWKTWAWFSAGAIVVWIAAHVARYAFHFWVAMLAIALMAALFFGPAYRGWGRRVSRAAWCQAGTYAMLAYLVMCGLAHHAAYGKVKAYADQKHIVAERMAALPIPPSWLDWGDAIRASNGLYESQFDLRDARAPVFRFTPDSPPDRFITRAFEIPDVQLYWQFARFPSVESFAQGDNHIVELGENRFTNGRPRGPQPFTFQVVFDQDENVLSEGWLSGGVLVRNMQPISPKRAMPAGTDGSEKKTQ